MIRRKTLLREVPYVLLLCVASAAVAQAQSWSGVLASTRAMDWTQAGLPATLPDGETTPNPWTPPTRTECGSDITTASFSGMSSSNYVSPTAINTAITNCTAGHYVHISASSGTDFYFSGPINMYLTNGISVRMDDAVKLHFNAAPAVTWISGSGATFGVVWAGAPSYAQGTSVIYLSTVSGLTAGTSLLELHQCDTGYSNGGTFGGCSGSATDNGGVYICSVSGTNCSEAGASEQIAQGAQVQTSLVTSINANGVNGCAAGSGNYCVGISPGLLMPNWSASQTPIASGLNPTWGVGLEGGTIDATNSSFSGNVVNMEFMYACWIYGTRIIGGQGGSAEIYSYSSGDILNSLLANNYFHQRVNFTEGTQEILVLAGATEDLIINNIFQNGPAVYSQAGTTGVVFAYNYSRDGDISGGTDYYIYANNGTFNHHPAQVLGLWEANQFGEWQDDDLHGSHALNTLFRNFVGGEPPYVTTSPQNRMIDAQGFARFDNAIGNVIGNGQNTGYQGTASNYVNGSVIFELGTGNYQANDTLTFSSFYRWGNFDVITGAVRWCGNSSSPGWSTTCSSTSEVPTSLSGNAAPFEQAVPSSTTLPTSFFICASYPCSGPLAPHANGGTGLSWWKVCTNWALSGNNGSCSTYATQPFPPIGPDVTGGTVNQDSRVNFQGHANNIPAYVAWKNLPIDTSYQSTYGITASSWSSGSGCPTSSPCETLTLSGGAGGAPLGEFQITSGPCAGTFFVTNAPSTTQIQYSLASAPTGDPNACTGASLLWPDVRQFGMLVYQSDGGSSSNPPAAPTGLTAIVQ